MVIARQRMAAVAVHTVRQVMAAAAAVTAAHRIARRAMEAIPPEAIPPAVTPAAEATLAEDTDNFGGGG